MKIVVALSAALAVVLFASASNGQEGELTQGSSPMVNSHIYTHPNLLVRIAGRRRINMLCMGRGKPTVLLVNGGDSNIMVWRKIQARVARFSRVCAFDKVGFGHSDAASRPSSVGHDVDDLHRLIDRSGIAPPVVLVGHSLGGEDAVLFAGRYRRVVAGMVLVDPAFDGQSRAWSAGRSADDLAKHRQMDQAALANAAQCLRQAQAHTLTRATDKLGCLDEDYREDPVLQAELDRQEMMAQNQAAQLSENENSTALATVRPSTARDPFESQDDRDAAGAPTNFGEMPLTVLSREIDAKCAADPACANGEGNWKAAHDRLAKYSTVGKSIAVGGAGHVIMEDKPDAVVDAVRDVVLAVRRKP